MNMDENQAEPEHSSHSREEFEKLKCTTQKLRQEALSLFEKNQSLLRQIEESRKSNLADRQIRQATLNLLEDAAAARKAQELENVKRRRSEARYRGLFESIDQGFTIIKKLQADPSHPVDFRFVEANLAFADHTGVRDVVGKTFREVFPGESEEWVATFDDILTSGRPMRFERELVSRGRILECYAFCLEDGGDNSAAFIFKDISSRKAAEEALREADRRKDEFLATLAHELRNPLAPIRNSLHLLHGDVEDRPDDRELCEMMERQLRIMIRLVDDLMEVSRITRGLIKMRKEPIDLAMVIRNAMETSRPLIEACGHQFSVEIPPDPVLLYGDPIRLGQAFSNLLNNAAKYTSQGGQITLGAVRAGSEVVISVRDTGTGISPAMLPTIFDMFNRASRSRMPGGLGIGLTLAKRLVEMHGGSISAFSEGLGKGSEFMIRLPIRIMDGKPSKEPAKNLSDSKLIRRRILVVDDNQDSASSLEMLLRSLGAEVQKANDGVTALRIAEAYHPNVVFLDLGMPGMDGFEVARRIRERPDSQSVMLVALTGWGTPGDRKRTSEAGFSHHLVKPADTSTILSVLSQPKS
jgi:PAS domain S-box-containing protein